MRADAAHLVSEHSDLQLIVGCKGIVGRKLIWLAEVRVAALLWAFRSLRFISFEELQSLFLPRLLQETQNIQERCRRWAVRNHVECAELSAVLFKHPRFQSMACLTRVQQCSEAKEGRKEKKKKS